MWLPGAKQDITTEGSPGWHKVEVLTATQLYTKMLLNRQISLHVFHSTKHRDQEQGVGAAERMEAGVMVELVAGR